MTETNVCTTHPFRPLRNFWERVPIKEQDTVFVLQGVQNHRSQANFWSKEETTTLVQATL